MSAPAATVAEPRRIARRPSRRRTPRAAVARAAALDASPEAVVIGRPGGRVLALNPAAERLFGCTARRARRLGFSNLVDRDAAPRPPRGACDGWVALDLRRADGGVFPAEVAFRPVGRAAVAAFVRDLSGAGGGASTPKDLSALRAAEAVSATGALLAGVAHELNNPLAILVAQATVLQDKAPNPDIARRAARIAAAAQRAGRVVKDLLALTRQRAPVPERTDLNAIVLGALDAVAQAFRDAGVAVEVALGRGLPDVLGDRELLGQAFGNLLANAHRALAQHDGARRLVLRSWADAEGVSVEVADTGAGVPPGLAERIFEPLFTTRPAGTALGLGLPLCRSILAEQGGTVRLAAGRGGGAAFRVVLPPAPGAAAAAGGLSVLVVDDEADVAEALADLIGLFGHAVEVATSAEAALDAVKGRRFDVAFADLRMPGLGGVALRRAFARLDPELAARTVIVTGDTLFRPAADGGHGLRYLGKPFTAQGVKALLDGMSAP